MRAQLGFCPKVTRHEPFDERSARFLYAGSPRHSRKSAESASRVLAGTTGNMARCPQGWDHGMCPVLISRRRTTSTPRTQGYILVVQTWCRFPLRSWCTLFTVLSNSSWTVSALSGTSRSMCSPLTPQGVEGSWQWSSLVAVLGTAQHALPAALTAFLDR